MFTTRPSPDSIRRGRSAFVTRSVPRHVRLVHEPPLLFVGLRDRLEAEGAAGVVDKDATVRHPAGERGDGFSIGDVEGERPSRRRELGGQGLDEAEAPRPEHCLETQRCEHTCRRRPDAARGAGDDGDTAPSRRRGHCNPIMALTP